MNKILKAIACCREKRCGECPMMSEFCDEMRVDMVDLPEELVELVEREMEEMEERIAIMMEGSNHG